MTGKWANFKYNPEWLSETLDSTFEGLGEMFEGDSAGMHAGKFMLVLLGEDMRKAVNRAYVVCGHFSENCGHSLQIK